MGDYRQALPAHKYHISRIQNWLNLLNPIPHLHICINRIGNNGKTISDRNEKYRSAKICRELTERYGLTIGEGKQEVNRSRLRGEDKLRYEIFDAIKSILPQSQTWKDFVAGLEQQGITTRFKTKGNTGVVQGITFEKDGCSFSGSKIDRTCSFSRLNAEIEQNTHKQEKFERKQQKRREKHKGH